MSISFPSTLGFLGPFWTHNRLWGSLTISVSNFIISLAASLRLGAIRKCSFSVPFRMDVFRHLFNDSGVKPIRGHGKNYYKDDFAERYFPSGWHIVHDHLGDGCQVDFPIRLHSKLRWSSVVYHKSEDGTLTRKLQSFTEVLVVNVVKKRCWTACL